MSAIPLALLRTQSELPFVGYQAGVQFQLVQANIESGDWVVRLRAEPGNTLQRHRHTGEVFAFTLAGSWLYLECPHEVNVAGSYLYEPAGSVHTLHIPASNTEVTDVWYVIHGANLNLDEAGNVESVLDAGAALEIYRAQCAAAGHAAPAVIGG